MKKFLQRASKSFGVPPKPGSSGGVVSPTTTGLQPKFTVPAVPHPCPWDHIAILVTDDALLLRPHFPDRSNSSSLTYVRVSFVKGAEIQEVAATDIDGHDWSQSVVVYGVLGILELFTGVNDASN